MEKKDIVYKDIISNVDNTGYISVYNEDAILQALKNLFFISKGEVPGHPEIGNPFAVLVFEPLDYFQKQAIKQSYINVIERFEPRVEIVDVILDILPDKNEIDIELIYINLFDSNDVINQYRFNVNYNNITNLEIREPV